MAHVVSPPAEMLVVPMLLSADTTVNTAVAEPQLMLTTPGALPAVTTAPLTDATEALLLEQLAIEVEDEEAAMVAVPPGRRKAGFSAMLAAEALGVTSFNDSDDALFPTTLVAITEHF